jgi:hypothetical protein
MHRFPQPVLPQKRSKNGAVSGAEVPGLVPFSFPRIVTVSPFFALLGTREGTPVFKTGLDLTQLQTQTRVAGTSCSRGAAYGANTLKAENSPAFQCLTTG